jgi:hypothetical protein
MGTNYYTRVNECHFCGRYGELHIGKHSGGWVFLFRGYKELGINSKKDWEDLLGSYKGIYDEYLRMWSPEEFWRIVEGTKKSPNKLPPLDEDGWPVCFEEFS